MSADNKRFAGFKLRLARSAAGDQALFTDEGVREKTGALLQRKLNDAVEKGSSGLRGVLAKVAEVDALRALRRRTGDEDPAQIDLQVRRFGRVFCLWELSELTSLLHPRRAGGEPRV
jgi:hypothetical protein